MVVFSFRMEIVSKRVG